VPAGKSQYRLAPPAQAAALSIVYNLIILAVCWVFYTVMTRADAKAGAA